MAKRIEALRQNLAGEAMLVTNPVNVAYLSGFSGTAGKLLVTPQNLFLLTDFRYYEQACAQSPLCQVVEVSGPGWRQTADLLGAERIGSLRVEADHLSVRLFETMKEGMSGINLLAEPSPVAELRRIKDEDEIMAIAAAVALADEAFAHILPFIGAGTAERDLALELEFFMRKKGASAPSFDFIVASGQRSALPHGVATEKRLDDRDAVVLDFGCVLDGYCSDLTRTVFVGEVTKKQREIYDAVLLAQKSALAGIRAGQSGKEADALARAVLAENDLAVHFGHGLGHGLGREIHEAPRLSPAGEEYLLPGMVVTVEPGVYLRGEFGVRIEDVIVVGKTGLRNLTASSKELFCF